jgi:hypothetical protein
MEGLLHRQLEDRQQGWTWDLLMNWYALAHAARCKPCHEFLTTIRINREKLRNARQSEPDSRTLQRLEKKLSEALSIEAGPLQKS